MRIGGRSRVLAVLGDPVGHSLSPVMHTAACAALGLDAVYVAFPTPVAALDGVLAACAAVGIAGNLTVPHKVAALGLMKDVTPAARRAGAVNTFWPVDGGLQGDNTDVAGVLEALAALDAPGPWLLAGTGGSARAVVRAAAERAVELFVRSRSAARAEEFAAWARGEGVRAVADAGAAAGTVINATPVGLSDGDPLPIPDERTAGARAALDLVYRPGETAWVRRCRGAGVRASDGRVLLVAQGAHAFERFFPGMTAPREVMRAAVARALAA